MNKPCHLCWTDGPVVGVSDGADWFRLQTGRTNSGVTRIEPFRARTRTSGWNKQGNWRRRSFHSCSCVCSTPPSFSFKRWGFLAARQPDAAPNRIKIRCLRRFSEASLLPLRKNTQTLAPSSSHSSRSNILSANLARRGRIQRARDKGLALFRQRSHTRHGTVDFYAPPWQTSSKQACADKNRERDCGKRETPTSVPDSRSRTLTLERASLARRRA